jgi:hypothetical protein
MPAQSLFPGDALALVLDYPLALGKMRRGEYALAVYA